MELKVYCVASQTNYDLMVHIVIAYSKEDAMEIAKMDGAWENADVYEIDTSMRGVSLNI